MKAEQKYYAISDAKILRPFLSRPLPSLAIHWIFQGILYMDVTEAMFKLSMDGILTILFSVILVRWLSFIPAVIIGVILAHTVNFGLNSQIFVVLKHFGDIKHEKHEVGEYISHMRGRIKAERSIRWGAIYGSISRGEMKVTSDVDIRLIRYHGFFNGIRACCFVLRERTRAHLKQFPLDILLLDSSRLLSRMRPDEPPIVFYDRSE